MKGTYIGIIAEDSPVLLTGLLGILKSGNAFVPINPVFPNHRIHFIINDCGIQVLLTDNANRDKARQIAEENPSIRHIVTLDDFTDSGSQIVEERDPGEKEENGYCYVIYTSGSTGRPKGVPITHRNVIPLFSWFRDYFQLGTHTRIVRNLSYTFDFGVFEILTTLLFGGCTHGVDKTMVGDFSRYPSFIDKHQVNTLHTTPVFFSNISEFGEKMPSLDLLHLGGERLTGKTVRRAAAVISPGARIYNGYGPTEATINCAIFALPKEEAQGAGAIDETDNIPIGSPSAFNELSILDSYNNPQPVGVPGELCVSGPGLAHGYLNRPELTAVSFSRGAAPSLITPYPLPLTPIYRTGDLCRWLPTGDIQFLGRIDHQVKVRGFRIELGEIENSLLKHPHIKEAVVVAKAHRSGTDYLCAYFVADTEITLSQLREFLLKELPDYMVPAYFVPLENIPLTPNGKTDLKALPEPDQTAIDTGVEYIAPETVTQEELVLIWQPLLRREKIGIFDDFFELGGDSILVNRCIARIREDLRVEIPLRTFFERPYIKALAEEIENRDRRVSSITPAARQGEIPLSFAQERLWFLQELDSENTAYFVPRVIRMKGDLDTALVERTFTEIIRRHEILRTVFPTVDGRPVQRIQPPYPFKIPILDWRGMEEEQQSKEVTEFLTREGVNPFNFETGPLLRVTILKLKEEKNLLVLTEHHLVHDGWTQGVLLREFITIFTAYSGNKEHRLPDLPIQYADYAVWQRNLLQGEVLESHLSYWAETLSGLAPVLDLPSDRPRPPVISGEGGLTIFRLSRSFTNQLMDFSHKNGVTLYMTMLAVFKTLLYRYTGVEDLCVGTGIANRGYKEMEGMLGMVINTLPLRTRVSGDITFSQCLRGVKETCLDAYQHEDTPFGKIVERLNPGRSLSYTSIFQVMFSFMDTPTEDLQLPGLDLELLDSHNRSSKFDINVVVVPPPGHGEDTETLVEWEYNTDIFDESTAHRMVAHYKTLLEKAVHTPGESLSALPMLSGPELNRLLYEFNDTASDYPRDKTIHRLFEEQVLRTPDAVALHMSDRTYMTYSQLNKSADRQAGILREKGVSADTVVGIMTERGVGMLTGMLAVLKAGGAYLPIVPQLPAARREYMIRDASVSVVLSHRFYADELNIGEITVNLDDMDLYTGIDRCFNPPDRGSSKNAAYVIYTSGSTGKPKGSVIEHSQLVNFVYHMYESFEGDFGPGDNCLGLTEMSFDVSVCELFLPLPFGASIVLLPEAVKFDVDELSKTILEKGITFAYIPPGLLPAVVSRLKADAAVSQLNKMLVGVESIRDTVLEEYMELNPRMCILNGYGPTETTICATMLKYRSHPPKNSIVPIGPPLSNMKAAIVDKWGNLVPPGVPGELCVSGAGVGRGYLNNPELTNSKFQIPNQNPPAGGPSLIAPYRQSLPLTPPLYHTGDLARWLETGDIEFIGRIDSQVKIRGYRVETGEIENQLLMFAGVKEAVVIARVDPGNQKYLCAYITAGEEIDIPAVKEFLSQKLPAYMVPPYITRIEKIPLTPHGKTDADVLPLPVIKIREEILVPRDDVEEKLAEIWGDVLNVSRKSHVPIGIDDNFFELGGHSLNAAVLTARVHKVFNVKFPLKEFFQKSCIREMAAYIKGAVKEEFTFIEPAEKKEYYPLSPAQRRLYLLHQIGKNSTAYNIPVMLNLEGTVDKNRIENVFLQLIERHESLRTSFAVVNEAPVQKIHKTVNFTLGNGSLTAASYPVRPFDLSRAPLLRVELIQREEQGYILMVDMHHIITDGTSMGVFVREFTSLYVGETLPSLPLQYKDYSRWRNHRAGEEIMGKRASYWKEAFSGDIPTLELPTDFIRPAVQSFEGARSRFEPDREETRLLKEFVSTEGFTLYTVLLAVFYVFLSKLSNSEDIVVGTAAAGRGHADLESIIGMFVNTLALKNHPRGRYSFKEFLHNVNQKTLQDFENQDYPFEELVENVSVNRDTGRNPLFDVFFVMQNVDIPEVEIPGLTLKPLPVETRTSKFDLMLQALETDETLLLTYEYDTALFKAETIKRFNCFFGRIVSAVIDRPSIKLSEIEIISPEEKGQILENFNNTKRDYPSDKTIHELFEEQALLTPDAVALHMSYGTYMTYTELNKESVRLARLLQTKGVGPSTIVGLQVERSIEMMTGMLGILKAGGAYLPMAPDYPEARIRYVLADSGMKVLLKSGTNSNDQNSNDQNRSTTPLVLNFEHLNFGFVCTSDFDIRVSDLSPSNLAYIIYTSGSTGRPKGVMVTHRNVVRLVKNTEFVPLSEETWILQTGVPVFDASTFEIWGGLLNGGRLVLAGKEVILDTQKLQGALKDHKINTLWLSSPLFNQLLQQNIEIFAPLRYLLVGGDVLSPPHFNRLRDRFPGLNAINGYGPTENTTFSTTYLIDKPFKQSIPIGRPISNSTAYILDPHRRLVPVGVFGELYVGGDGVARGYLNNPDLTAERFVISHRSSVSDDSTNDLLYRTGDLCRWLPDGTIDFKGRIDRQVKIRGFRIELEEIENRLLHHPNIEGAVVIPRERDGGKYLCAYIVPGVGPGEVKGFLSQTLPGYMIPSFFVSLEKIPLTPNGKVDRGALPEPRSAVAGGEYEAPRDETEEKLVEMWSDVLGISRENISVTGNFFELGGHSLNAVVLSAGVHKVFNVKFPFNEFFQKSCIREMAAYIKGAVKEEFTCIEPAEKKEYYPLAPAQMRLYILNRLEKTTTAYNIPYAVQLEGRLDVQRLEGAFEKLIRRHESFRTFFFSTGDTPVQGVRNNVESKIEYTAAAQGEEGEAVRRFVRPFDLSAAPLLRVGLVRSGEEKHILIVDMHHIISDGVSSGILIEDFTALYPGGEPAGIRLRYKDYAEWLNSDRESGKESARAGYWKAEFAGEIPVLDLPLDFPRPAARNFEGDRLKFELTGETASALKALAVETGTTLYMVLLALYNVFLFKITGREDIVTGTPEAGRGHADLQKIIGMFVNTLALRNYPAGEKPFTRFLDEVKEKTLDAFENREYPYEDLVEQVVGNRDLSRNPLFDTMFVLQNTGTRFLEIPGLKLAPYELESKISKFDLTLTAVETETKLLFTLEYCTQLFKPGTIRRFIDYFKNSVSGVLEDGRKPLAELEIIPAEEKNRLLYDFNNTGTDYPENKTLHRLFEEQAEKTPDHIALVGPAEPGGGIRESRIQVTYHELNEQSNRSARLLIEKGVLPGTIAGIMIDRSVEMIAGLLGILKSGGAYLPIDPEYPEERKQYMMKDSGAHVLLTQSLISRSNNRSAAPLKTAAPSSGLAYVIYTSGSTGKPKGVLIEHRSIINTLHWRKNRYGFGQKDTALQLPSFSFDSSVEDIFTPLAGGSRLVLIHARRRFDLNYLKRLLVNFRVTHFLILPNLYPTYLDEIPESLRGLRTVTAAGENFTEDLVKRHFERLSHVRLFNEYGPTENSVCSTVYEFSPHKTRVLIGRPINNVNCYILNRRSKLTPVGIPGELCVSGPGLARGYLNRPELTAKTFYRSYKSYKTYISYKTGDLARWLETGDIEFLGRIDHQVKIRGYRVELGEIQNRLKEHQDVNESVVVAKEVSGGEKSLFAFIVTRHEPDIPGIKDHLLGALPAYMVPSFIVPVEKIPITPNGKVDIDALPDPFTAPAEEYIAPRNEDEEKIVDAWSEVLEIERDKIGINDNFFDRGGNSLKVIRLSRKLETVLDMEIPVMILFRYSTIHTLSEYLSRGRVSGPEFLDTGKLELIEDSIQDTLKLFGDE